MRKNLQNQNATRTGTWNKCMEPPKKHILSRMNNWCSGHRDLDPGRRLERPVYLTGLFYRSLCLEASSRMFFPSNKPYPSRIGLLASLRFIVLVFWLKQKSSYLLNKLALVLGLFSRVPLFFFLGRLR